MSDRREVTTALLDMLRAAASFPVGDGTPPPEEPGKPWATVYSLDGGTLHDDVLSAHEYGTSLVYQVTSVGRRRDQAEWAADLVRRTLLARTGGGPFQVPWPAMFNGLTVFSRTLLGGVGGVQSSGTGLAELNFVPERFTLHIST